MLLNFLLIYAVKLCLIILVVNLYIVLVNLCTVMTHACVMFCPCPWKVIYILLAIDISETQYRTEWSFY